MPANEECRVQILQPGETPSGKLLNALLVGKSSRLVTHQPQPGALRCWIAALCLALTLIITSVEAVHTHPNNGSSQSSGTTCLICMSVHANAPALTGHVLPVLFAVGVTAVVYEMEAPSIASRLELFTRPPPLAS